MTDDHSAEPRARIPALPAQTLLIGVDSGHTILVIKGYKSAELGDRIELGPAFDPPGTEAIVMKTRIADADGEEPLLVHEVLLRTPGKDADLS